MLVLVLLIVGVDVGIAAVYVALVVAVTVAYIIGVAVIPCVTCTDAGTAAVVHVGFTVDGGGVWCAVVVHSKGNNVLVILTCLYNLL